MLAALLCSSAILEPFLRVLSRWQRGERGNFWGENACESFTVSILTLSYSIFLYVGGGLRDVQDVCLWPREEV